MKGLLGFRELDSNAIKTKIICFLLCVKHFFFLVCGCLDVLNWEVHLIKLFMNLIYDFKVISTCSSPWVIGMHFFRHTNLQEVLHRRERKDKWRSCNPCFESGCSALHLSGDPTLCKCLVAALLWFAYPIAWIEWLQIF